MNPLLQSGRGTWQHGPLTPVTNEQLPGNRVNQDSRKLLIVEDDPGLLSQLKWCFEGYDVVTAEDRGSAINELRRHEPMVVLQDLGLPPNPEGVDEGLATLRETLRLAPHTKVIVVTGHGDQENALKAVGLGAYDFYQKPVNTDTLQLLVERAFNISELERENRRLQSLATESPLDGIVAASELTHAVPTTRGSVDFSKLERELAQGKFTTNRLIEGSGNAFFPDHCLGAGCAKWAVDAATAFADDFFVRLGIQPSYQEVSFGLPE